MESVNPANGKPIAAVAQVSFFYLKKISEFFFLFIYIYKGNVINLMECIDESQRAWEMWADVNSIQMFRVSSILNKIKIIIRFLHPNEVK